MASKRIEMTTTEEASPKIFEGSQVAFVFTSIETVPAKVLRVYPKMDCDLEITFPQRKAKLDHRRKIRVDAFELGKDIRPRCMPCNPIAPVRRQELQLANPQMHRDTGAVAQTHTDRWIVDESRLLLLPRFDAMPPLYVGRYFDPTVWDYRVWCYKGEYKVGPETEPDQQDVFPAEEKTFPEDGTVFPTYRSAYETYYHEIYYREHDDDPPRWDRVEMRPVAKV